MIEILYTNTLAEGIPRAESLTQIIQADKCDQQREFAMVYWDKAKQQVVDRQYINAVDAFEKAYNICPEAIFLHNMALCYQHAGKFQQAIAMYQRYIKESKEKRFYAEAFNNIKLLSTLLKQQDTLDRDRLRPLWKRTYFWAGLGAGILAITGLSIGLGVGFSPQALDPTFRR